MKVSKHTKDALAAILLVVAVALRILSSSLLGSDGDSQKVADKLSARLKGKISQLDSYLSAAMDSTHDSWLDLGEVPAEYTIYRYCSDTLQAWVNEFPVINDDIRSRVVVPYIFNPRSAPSSPLSNVGEDLSFESLGEKWYLTKALQEGDCRVIAGLEVIGTQGPCEFLKLPAQYSILPLSLDGGAIVSLRDRPLFEIARQTSTTPNPINANLAWLSLAFIILSAIVFLSATRSLRRLGICLAVLVASMLHFYFLGTEVRSQSAIFSPMLYAGGEVLYSLGAIVIINLFLLAICFSIYLCRIPISERLSKRKWRSIAAILLSLGLSAGILAYMAAALSSVILNSGISLELYRISSLTLFCVVIYLSFISTLLCIPLLLQSVSKLSESALHLRFNFFSLTGRVVTAVLIAVFLIAMSGSLGFRKEQKEMEVLSSRLSFERDISLEMYLRNSEAQIADDMVISALSVFNNTAPSIRNRISDHYFARYERNYSFSVFVFNPNNRTRAAADQYKSLTSGATPISDSSRFLYVKNPNGQSYYLGVFLYLIEGVGVSRVLIRIDTKDPRDDKGYAGIFGFSSSGRASVPPGYSYAKYEGAHLSTHRGSFAYPTELKAEMHTSFYNHQLKYIIVGGHRHFVNLVANDEAIVISRPKISWINYVVAAILVALLSFLLLSLVIAGHRKKSNFSHSYFRSRITITLLASLILTLLVVASVSVVFVYTKNESNNRSVMYDRIGSIASMFEVNQNSIERSGAVFDWKAMQQTMVKISEETRSDITLYSPVGRLMMSTTPMVFEGHILGERINAEAFRTIMQEHRRACVIREQSANISYFSMYASVLGSDGRICAIVCSPYSLNSFQFEEDAITHAATILSLFLVFLLVALLAVSRIVDRMFQPLSDMSLKMSKSDLQSLEYVDYEREDEVSSIVQAYNRMVREMILSSKKLAQAERDKAWSEMARQVAHEIKNPLTPMRLQIQRVKRLKDRNAPHWLERFDEATVLLLDHIDLLTETANEFSSFAKLYSEDPADIDLAKALQSELSMFDNHPHIRFEFIGLEGVTVRGPKPQLTRVFVNLLNNSVQAIGDNTDGMIVVSLRNSSTEGYYEILFEDNGPGVADAHIPHLFTPNFTTKNGGSGLGLAISRSVLESCGATISYSRSFTLGGACFTIVYPK